nr:hypothetical protein [Pandoravirus aubagnensis]
MDADKENHGAPQKKLQAPIRGEGKPKKACERPTQKTHKEHTPPAAWCCVACDRLARPVKRSSSIAGAPPIRQRTQHSDRDIWRRHTTIRDQRKEERETTGARHRQRCLLLLLLNRQAPTVADTVARLGAADAPEPREAIRGQTASVHAVRWPSCCSWRSCSSWS